MAVGFFMNVLEVESINERKSRDPKAPLASTWYARLRLEGGSITVQIKDGLKITTGWAGRASGSCRIANLKREWNGRLSDVTCLVPAVLDQWVPSHQVETAGTALDSFMSAKK
jgi:hypothetical protein